MPESRIEIRCPGCRARYWVEPEQLGTRAECGQCGVKFAISREEVTPVAPAPVAGVFDGEVQHANVTITAYMHERGISGGVSLEESDGSAAARGVLETDSGRRYAVGNVVAQGGMGAILNCRDLNIRRNVAMKVMLDPEQVGQAEILRFIEEAQVTGQLEHPGVVPVYELGVDAGGNVFYTMKFVRGRTLKDVLKGLADRDVTMLAAFPTSRLLTLFVRACEAMAYAHHKRVVHRDLKPENIMIGDFGEVYVMDWGLAKVLQTGKDDRPDLSDRPDPSGPDDDSSIESARASVVGEPVNTLDGAVMGTPYYMAPEQARGDVAAVDQRADVYALGGILYELLSLRRAVDGGGVMAILKKVTMGDLAPLPTTADVAARPHCPGGQIPTALAAVAMKALALKPEDRYQTVQELQADIEAYQGGFATSAEQAGLWRQLVLLVQRHRRECSLAAVALVVIVGLATGFVIRVNAEKNRAVRAETAEAGQRQAAESARASAEKARAEAEVARDRAVTAETETKKAYATLEQENYYNAIVAAEGMTAGRAFDRAEELLWKAPPRLRQWEWGHLLRRCQIDLLTLRGHSARVNAAVFTPDGTQIISSSWDCTLRVWDVKSGRELATFRSTGVRDLHKSLAISPDGRFLATGEAGPVTLLWDARAGTVLRGIGERGVGGWPIAFSPDSRELVTAGLETNDKRIRFWDVATGRELRSLPGSEQKGDGIRAVCFSPDGSRFAAAGRDPAFGARIWDTESGRQVQALCPHGCVTAAAFSPDGQHLACGTDNGVVALHDVATGAETKVCTLSGVSGVDAITQVAFSPDGQRLAFASSDRTARVWDVQAGREVACLAGHGAAVRSVVFSPDGRMLATASADGTVKLWPSAGAVAPVHVLPNRNPLNYAAISPDGRRLGVAQEAGVVEVRDVNTGLPLLRPEGHSEAVYRALFSRDGTRLVTAGHEDKTVRVWDAATGKQILVLPQISRVGEVAITSDGRRIATVCDLGDPFVHLWDGTTGKEMQRIKRHCYGSLAFSPDDHLIAGGHENAAYVWEVETGREVLVLPGQAMVRALAFTRDATRLATACSVDRTVRIWELPSGRKLFTLRGHADAVRAVAFSPDGYRLLSGSDDQTVRLWDTATGREILTLEGHKAPIVSVAFFPDGKRYMSASKDGDIRIWDTLDWTLTREQIEQQKLERYQRWLEEK